MKGSLIAFDALAGRGAAALLRDGRLDDLLIDPPDERIRPGAIYRARAGRPMKGQGGMILETPDGPLFLRQSKGLASGDTFLVQTSTFAERGKATPCGTRLLFKSRYCLVTPDAPGLNISKAIHDEERTAELREMAREIMGDRQVGLIVRSAAGEADDAAIRDDFRATADIAARILSEPAVGAPERLLDGPDASALAWRDWPMPDVTDADVGSFARHGIDEMIEGSRHPRVALPGGAAMYVEPTRALTAVDVNTEGDTSPAAGLKANIAAVRELPRALRLRGIGGQIVIDFAPMPKRDRTQLEQVMRGALRTDPIETSLVGWTPLGHHELQRKKERLPLSECLI